MLQCAYIILAEAHSGGSVLTLIDYRGGLSGGIFTENRVLFATRFVLATYACIGKRAGPILILTHFLVPHRKGSDVVSFVSIRKCFQTFFCDPQERQYRRWFCGESEHF
jgi:hypothetical protein